MSREPARASSASDGRRLPLLLEWSIAVRELDLPPLAKLVAHTARTYMSGSSPRYSGTVDTLADGAAVDRRTVQRYLPLLVEKGLVRACVRAGRPTIYVPIVKPAHHELVEVATRNKLAVQLAFGDAGLTLIEGVTVCHPHSDEGAAESHPRTTEKSPAGGAPPPEVEREIEREVVRGLDLENLALRIPHDALVYLRRAAS
jgi:hypothetical protein